MQLKNQTPDDLRAKKFMDLVMKDGIAPSKAAKAVNVSLADIRTKPGIWAEVRSLIERTEKLLDPEIRKKIAKAKILELVLQDEDMKVSLGAAKIMHDELGLITKNVPQIGIQVNLLKEEPTVKAALDTIDIDGELVFDEKEKVYKLANVGGGSVVESTDAASGRRVSEESSGGEQCLGGVPDEAGGMLGNDALDM